MAATILVVEDDPAVSLALEVALKGEGYTALLAATLAHAAPETPLDALPYTPSLHEDMILRGRRIVADQMDFLLASVPRSSRLHA